jgi:hypothetical protein
MWHLLATLVQDLTTGSWISRLCFGGLVLLSLFSLGSLGGFSVQAIKMKWTNSSVSIPSSGSAFEPLTIPSLSSKPSTITSEQTWTTKKPVSEPLSTGATGSKP